MRWSSPHDFLRLIPHWYLWITHLTWDSVQILTNHKTWAFSPTSSPDLADLFCSMSIMLDLPLPLGVNFSLPKEWCMFFSSFIFGAANGLLVDLATCLLPPQSHEQKRVRLVFTCFDWCVGTGRKGWLAGRKPEGPEFIPGKAFLRKDYGIQGWFRSLKSLSSRNFRERRPKWYGRNSMNGKQRKLTWHWARNNFSGSYFLHVKKERLGLGKL